MDRTDHPIRSIYEGVSSFYKGNVIDEASKRELYHGNLVIFGPPGLIEDFTFERYGTELENIKKKAGEKGYDDPERLAFALRKMSVFKERRGKDRDGAIAISDASDGYRIARAGGYVTIQTKKDEILDEFLSQASGYKGGAVNGRHIAGFNFSRFTDDETGAVIASKGGSSIVTAVGDELVPEYSDHIERAIPQEGMRFWQNLKNMWSRYVGVGEE